MTAPLRIALLASGRGSNLQALLDASRHGRLAVEWAGVFSDRPASCALERARAAGVDARGIDPADHADRTAFDNALFAAVSRVQPQLIVLAGYMRIVSHRHVRDWRGKMINIHPSLLPKYPGLRTHARALAAGEAEHGATVHYVTQELDGGPAIAQARVPVHAGDSADSLGKRVLACEHALLVATVAAMADGRLALHGDAVLHDGARLAAPLELDADGGLQRPPC